MLLKKINLGTSYILVVSLLCLAIGQCKDLEDCRSLYRSVVRIQFVPADKSKQQPLYFKEIDWDKKRYFTRVFYDEVSRSLFVFLNPTTNATTISLYREGLDDSITVFYQRSPSLLSPVCGMQQAYTLDSLQTTFVGDSIIHKTLNTEKGSADVQIFY